MSDRTQTLLVEVTREEIKLLLGGRDSDPTSQVAADRERARGKLRTALSQPEHQGDEDSELRELADRIWEVAKGLGAGDPARELKEINQALYKRLREPPAPVLSEEERDLLLEIAGTISASAIRRPAADQYASFLRNLASEEHRGEEGDLCPSCDLGQPTGCTCSAAKLTAELGLCRRLLTPGGPIAAATNAILGAELSDDAEQACGMAYQILGPAVRSAAPHVDLTSLVGGKPKSGRAELRAALDFDAASQPPAGELERLRAERAETALEELAEEFEHRASANETARDECGGAQDVDGEAYHQGRGHSNRQAASLAREKAAKLKGERDE